MNAKTHSPRTRAESFQTHPPAGWESASRFLLPALVFLWPFVFLHSFLFPSHGKYRLLGNDFEILYANYKIYLLASLADGRLPLWSPSEAAGFPFFSNPFAQTFYPFNPLLLACYRLFGGYDRLDHQVYTVFGIALFSLGLFLWLRRLTLNPRSALFATLVMSVSFKVTEIMRFPNAVHTAAWYPWIMYAVAGIMLSRRWKAAAGFGVLLAFSLVCLMTGGYFYFLYYSAFLLGPYLLVFFLPSLRRRFWGDRTFHWKRILIVLAVSGFAALAICLPYLVHVVRLMGQTTDRGGKSFGYSTSHVFNFVDTVGSLFFPPASQAEGWYFFSILGVLLILWYFLGARSLPGAPGIAPKGADGAPSGANPWVKVFFALWTATISYITYGRSSFLFILLWLFLPGFSSLRVWGRLNIVLVPILAWVLALAYGEFEKTLTRARRPQGANGAPKQSSPLWLLTAIYAQILAIQLVFYRNGIFDPYWVHHFRHVSSRAVDFIWFGAGAYVLLAFLVAFRNRLPLGSSLSLTIVALSLALYCAAEMAPVGGRMWSARETTRQEHLRPNVNEWNAQAFRVPRTNDSDTIVLGPRFNVGTLPNWYFDRYIRFLNRTKGELPQRETLLGMRDGRKLFFSESLNHNSVRSFLADADRFGDPARVVSYTGDELVVEIESPAEGHLSFIDNWDPAWKAFIDGRPTNIDLLFGTFKSVALTKGKHAVRFVYCPTLF